MNVKEYISSGIVESYVMGLVSDAERQEFEALCMQYPEIVSARNAFELAMEEKLLNDAKQPPQHLKQIIESRILGTDLEINSLHNKERTPVRTMGIWKWVAAASIILLAATGYWGITNYNHNKDLTAANSNLENRLQESTSRLNEFEQEAGMLKKPGVKMAALKGTESAPQAFATVYWDTASTKDVYLLVNNMPQPPTNKQYQLWAMLDGKPLNLGVIDMNIKQEKLLVKMQNVQNAQAFAITLEPSGGSDKPTMPIYVMGTL